MTIFENNRIRVEITDEQSAAWNHDRAKILSRAMQILGNRSESQCMESDVYTDEEYIAEGISAFVSDYLVEKFPDNCGEILMRMRENRRLAPGMVRGIAGANAFANSKPRDEIINRGKKSIEYDIATEKNYRHRFDKNDWKIEIIGDMPEQIGMCRYKNFSFQGVEMIEATVKPHSTSAHVGLPKKWTGCRVAVVRLDEGSESTEPR
jgi:putative transposon-encoded protein